MKTILFMLLLCGTAFCQADGHEYPNAKLLNVQIRDINGYKGPIFLIKYDPNLPSVWFRPADLALTSLYLSFALTSLSTGNVSLNIVTGSKDSNNFMGLLVMKYPDP